MATDPNATPDGNRPPHQGVPRRRRAGHRTVVAVGTILTALAATTVAPTTAGAIVTTQAVTARISVATGGAQISATHHTLPRVALDGTGRLAFFTTDAALVAGDDNGTYDVYLRDLRDASTRLATKAADGTSLTAGPARLCGLSDNGRFLTFFAPPAGSKDEARSQVWLLDRVSGDSSIVSVTTGETASGGSGPSGISTDGRCGVSDDGRYVAFSSEASNLSGNGFEQVFRRDRTAGETLLMSISTTSTAGDGRSESPSMTKDGLLVAFQSNASNLVAGDTNGKTDAFVRYPGGASTFRVSLKDDDTQVTDGVSNEPEIAAAGRYVAFISLGSGLTAGETGSTADAYVRDMNLNTTELVSTSGTEVQADGGTVGPSISADGRFVAFNSTAANLYPAKVAGIVDTYLRDRSLGTTTLASRRAGSIASADGISSGSAVSHDGKVVAFSSKATNLVRNDTNGTFDAHVHQFAVDAAPFGSFEALVAQQYQDFVGRAPTSAESAEWRARLVHGEQSPDSALVAFARSSAFAAKRAPLIRLYWAFFLRVPDQGGLDYWTGKLAKGSSLAAVAKQFSASSEFQSKYGSKTNAQFVTLIYQNIFQRDPDAAGLAYWTKKLDTKQKTRGDVMVNFSESSEGVRRLAPQADTVLLHLGMFGSMPSKDTLTGWIAQQGLGGVPSDIAHSFRGQAAYASRITP